MNQRETVYRVANELRTNAHRIADELPAGRARVADQLRGTTTAIVFRIAASAGTSAPDEQARLYRMARHSTTEAAAILDACRIVSPSDEPALDAARKLLLQIFAGLTDLLAGTPASSAAGSRHLLDRLHLTVDVHLGGQARR